MTHWARSAEELRPLQGHCRLALGRLHAAGAELTAALAAYRALGMSFWAACTEEELTRLTR